MTEKRDIKASRHVSADKSNVKPAAGVEPEGELTVTAKPLSLRKRVSTLEDAVFNNGGNSETDVKHPKDLE